MKKKIKTGFCIITFVFVLTLTACGVKTTSNDEKSSNQNEKSSSTEKIQEKTELKVKEQVESKEKTTKTSTESKSESEEDLVDIFETFAVDIYYSNLYDDASKDLAKKALYKAGLGEEDAENDPVNDFLSNVSEYNYSVGVDAGLIEKGFELAPELADMRFYDPEIIEENWFARHPDFIGYNCRLTSFLLMEDLIDVKGKFADSSQFYFMDDEAIVESKNPNFTEDNIKKFNTIFSAIPVELHKDVNRHLQTVKDYWAKHDLSFNKADARIITVWMHDELDNVLFVGHAGVLVPNPEEEDILFIEKVSFQDPYQMLKFADRQALSDYLMAKYDIAYGQPTAKPFIMENDDMIDGYRANPQNQ